MIAASKRRVTTAISQAFRSRFRKQPHRSADSCRTMCQLLGQAIATDLPHSWTAGKSQQSGEIDVVDFFSGCGGMTAGFVAANAIGPTYRVHAAIDIDSVANQSFAMNMGVSPFSEDVFTLRKRRNRMRDVFGQPGKGGRPLVLIGCAPCQGFSSHRNAAGENDNRNSLFVEFARIAAAVKPEAVVVENVPEILTDRYWPVVSSARSILEKAGYFVSISVHNMAQFGVPQERFRALVLATKHPHRIPQGFLERGQYKTVRDAIGGLPAVVAGEKCKTDSMHYTAGHRESTIDTIREVPKDGGSRPDHVGPECLRRAKALNGRAVYEDVYGRLFWDRPAITITAHSRNPASGRFVHPEQDRGLSVREAALLQGFPPDYEFAGSLDQRFRQIGNAVPPTFAAYLALHVLGEILNGKPDGECTRKGLQRPVGPSFSRLIPALKAGHRENFGG